MTGCKLYKFTTCQIPISPFAPEWPELAELTVSLAWVGNVKKPKEWFILI